MTDNTPIQIVDDNDSPIGEATINEAYDKNLLHRVVYIIVEDHEGRILLQKRGPAVRSYPNRWDISSAGHVDAGESYEAAAKREMGEEIGVRGSFELQEIAYFRSDEKHSGRLLSRFNKIYRTVIPADSKLELQADEVAEVKWLEPAEVQQIITSRPDEVATGLTLSIEHYENYEH
jgi:isopentenyldiphosphate isomerase